MEFGNTDTEHALGCVLAHTVKLPTSVLRKGTVIDPGVIDQLRQAGVQSVMAARLFDNDVAEDDAARLVAAGLAGLDVVLADAYTGRVNLYAGQAGLLVVEEQDVRTINRVDEGVTLATLRPLSRVGRGQMVATVKIIPFAVARSSLDEIGRLIAARGPMLTVAAFRAKRVELIMCRFGHEREKVMAKRQHAVTTRIMSLGGTVGPVTDCPHSVADVAAAIRDSVSRAPDLILVFGASAIVDRGDVIPAALRQAGGEILQLGMPVDPGNLLLCGEIAGCPLVGVPSCASSIKQNGFDWVLERIFCDQPVDREAFVAMACGGLLTEIASRPQPRESRRRLVGTDKHEQDDVSAN